MASSSRAPPLPPLPEQACPELHPVLHKWTEGDVDVALERAEGYELPAGQSHAEGLLEHYQHYRNVTNDRHNHIDHFGTVYNEVAEPGRAFHLFSLAGPYAYGAPLMAPQPDTRAILDHIVKGLLLFEHQALWSVDASLAKIFMCHSTPDQHAPVQIAVARAFRAVLLVGLILAQDLCTSEGWPAQLTALFHPPKDPGQSWFVGLRNQGYRFACAMNKFCSRWQGMPPDRADIIVRSIVFESTLGKQWVQANGKEAEQLPAYKVGHLRGFQLDPNMIHAPGDVCDEVLCHAFRIVSSGPQAPPSVFRTAAQRYADDVATAKFGDNILADVLKACGTFTADLRQQLERHFGRRTAQQQHLDRADPLRLLRQPLKLLIHTSEGPSLLTDDYLLRVFVDLLNNHLAPRAAGAPQLGQARPLPLLTAVITLNALCVQTTTMMTRSQRQAQQSAITTWAQGHPAPQGYLPGATPATIVATPHTVSTPRGYIEDPEGLTPQRHTPPERPTSPPAKRQAR